MKDYVLDYGEEVRERCAELVEQMLDMDPWKDQAWARCALMVAARAIRRGRHLTASEQLENLAKSLEEDGSPEGLSAAAKIRARKF